MGKNPFQAKIRRNKICVSVKQEGSCLWCWSNWFLLKKSVYGSCILTRFSSHQYSDIPTKVVTSGKSWLTGQNSSEKVQMRCYRGVREKVLYSVTWEEDSQNISLKTEKNDERSFSRIPEYLRKIFWYRLTPVEFFSCLNLIGRAKGLYFIQNHLYYAFCLPPAASARFIF